ncbi:MAG: tetratricopeptide repeat protein [Kofleriaceae bacterium]
MMPLLVLLAACGGAQHPAEPKPDVRAEVRDAETAERARQHDVARQKYEHAIADAHDAESLGFARGRFGETLATWGEYKESLSQLEGSVTAWPTDPAPWHDLGVVREHEGDSRGALDAFGHAANLARTDWRPRLAIAALRWKLAAKCFKDTTGDCATEVAATKTEYQAMLELDLPDRLREKVKWALSQLALPRAGLGPATPATPASGPTP